MTHFGFGKEGVQMIGRISGFSDYKELYNAIIDTAQTVILLLDKEGKISYSYSTSYGRSWHYLLFIEIDV